METINLTNRVHFEDTDEFAVATHLPSVSRRNPSLRVVLDSERFERVHFDVFDGALVQTAERLIEEWTEDMIAMAKLGRASETRSFASRIMGAKEALFRHRDTRWNRNGHYLSRA